MMCCDDGNSEMAKLLLDYQANPDLQQSVKFLKLLRLIDNDKPYYVMQETGYTPLMFACKGGHLDTVMVLMEHRADAKIRNVVCHTAFYSLPNISRYS